MKILIPAAGEGSRFAKQGYTFPKPIIDVNGSPMLQRVVENLSFPDAEHIFLLRKEHCDKYHIDVMVKNFAKNTKVVIVDSLTEGAACTALLAKSLINDDDALLIANSDQIIEYSKENFKILKDHTKADSFIYVFNDTHPKWSFVKLDSNGFVNEVAEKNPISNIATCGVYYFRHGADFVYHAEQMIRNNIRVNNEFYIAPVFNELIKSKLSILPFYVSAMHGIGTPEDLKAYLKGQ